MLCGRNSRVRHSGSGFRSRREVSLSSLDVLIELNVAPGLGTKPGSQKIPASLIRRRGNPATRLGRTFVGPERARTRRAKAPGEFTFTGKMLKLELCHR
jgi:hypothetical protein